MIGFSEPFIRRPIGDDADVRRPCSWRAWSPTMPASRRQPAERVAVPVIVGVGRPARRRPGHDGGDGRRAAGAAAVRDRGRHRAHLQPRRWAASNISVQFDLGRNADDAARDVQAALNAAGHRPAERPADAADLPQVQLRRGARHDPGADLRHAAHHRALRCGRHRPGAAHLAGRPAWPQVSVNGADQPAIRVQARAAAARRHGRRRWTTCATPSPTPTWASPWAASTARTSPRRWPPTIACARPRTTAGIVVKSSNGGTIVRLGDVAEVQQSGVRTRRQPPAGSTRSRADPAHRHQAARRQRDRHGGTGSRRCCRS